MSRPARALVDAQALRDNFKQVKHYAPAAKVMAVVKANGYGHGLDWVADVLRDADAFAVASVEEGVQIRESGLTQPVCLLSGFFDSTEFPELQRYRLSPVIHYDVQLRALEQQRLEGPLDVWIKLDTGMHRLGFEPERLPELLARVRACEGIGKVAVMSHLANADDPSDATTDDQIRRFMTATTGFELERSLANSAGVIAWPASRLEWVRPGVMLYGASPLINAEAAGLGLRPVMTLVSTLIAVQRRRKGDSIGYGGDWVCPEELDIGVVAIGYGDGYPRHAPVGTPVLVSGRRVPLVGRVSMDMLTVDLRQHPEARVGDPVVLWGQGLPVDDVAGLAGTIAYQLLCNVTVRVPRVETPAEEIQRWQG